MNSVHKKTLCSAGL